MNWKRGFRRIALVLSIGGAICGAFGGFCITIGDAQAAEYALIQEQQRKPDIFDRIARTSITFEEWQQENKRMDFYSELDKEAEESEIEEKVWQKNCIKKSFGKQRFILLRQDWLLRWQRLLGEQLDLALCG